MTLVYFVVIIISLLIKSASASELDSVMEFGLNCMNEL